MTEPQFHGDCFRCGGLGHWADSDNCPWLKKAATKTEHQARIDSLRDRFTEFVITPWQRREYIKHENKLWYDGKVPSAIALGEFMITIYGASDDLVEVSGCEGADEFNTEDWQADLIAPDGSQMRVGCAYGAGEDAAVWGITVSQTCEESQLPGWPVTITQAPALNPDNAGYSPLLTIDAPEGTRLANIKPALDES